MRAIFPRRRRGRKRKQRKPAACFAAWLTAAAPGAFSSEVGTGSREENAAKQKS
jgi:hypothetical protein